MSLKVSHQRPESYFVKMTDGLREAPPPDSSLDVSFGYLSEQVFLSAQWCVGFPGRPGNKLLCSVRNRLGGLSGLLSVDPQEGEASQIW